jgi:hypothetical protein
VAVSTENLPATNAKSLGHFEGQGVARLQIRLIEARERQLRARRHEERIQELLVTVERLVAADEFDLDLVGTGSGLLRRHHQMPLGDSRSCFLAVHDDASNPLGWLREIEHHPMSRLQIDAYGDAAADRRLAVPRDDDTEVVAQVLKRGAAFRRERFRHTRTDRSRRGSLHRR